MTTPSTPGVSAVTRATLPGRVQRWLDRALPPEAPLAQTIHLEQEGKLDVRGNWTPFQASGVYTVYPLAFEWRAKLRALPGVWIRAEDGHTGSEGWGGARLWGLIPLGSRRDPQVLKSQLVRNLGELAWLPAFVLQNPDLQWTGLDDHRFEVRTTAGGQAATVQFELNTEGDIVCAESPARPYDVPGGYEAAPWHITYSGHRTFSGVRIPAEANATFEKAAGAWHYFQCRVTAVALGGAVA